MKIINSLCQHLTASIGKAKARPVLDYFMRIMSTQGTEACIERMKAVESMLKLALMKGEQSFAGVECSRFVTGYIKHRRVFKRVPKLKEFRQLLYSALRCYSENDLSSQHAKNILMFIATSKKLKLHAVTDKQWQKASSDINTPMTEENVIAMQDAMILISSINPILDSFGERVMNMSYHDIPDLIGYNKLNKKTSQISDGSVQSVDVNSSSRDPYEIISWCKYHKMSYSFAERLCKGIAGVEPTHLMWTTCVPGNEYRYAGKIGFIQEPGGKLRVVASPLLWIQIAMESEKRKLESLLRAIPEVYTFNQQLGIDRAIAAMGGGIFSLYCYDLTAFTDRFPFEIQRKVADRIMIQTGLLSEVCRSKWLASTKGKPSEDWQYQTGQPMGLGPSFFLATLTHWALLASLCKKHGYKVAIGSHLPFGINGDDVWISNPKVAQDYHDIMTSMGVTINPTKSIVSNTHGEFLGTKFNHLGVQAPPVKFRKQAASIPQVIKSLDFYGKRLIRLLPHTEFYQCAIKLPFLLGGPRRNVVHDSNQQIAILRSYIDLYLDKLKSVTRLDKINHTILSQSMSTLDSIKSTFNALIASPRGGVHSTFSLHIRTKKDIEFASLDDIANHTRGLQLMGTDKVVPYQDPMSKLLYLNKVQDLIANLNIMSDWVSHASNSEAQDLLSLFSEIEGIVIELLAQAHHEGLIKLSYDVTYKKIIEEVNNVYLSKYKQYLTNSIRYKSDTTDPVIKALKSPLSNIVVKRRSTSLDQTIREIHYNESRLDQTLQGLNNAKFNQKKRP